MLLRAVNSDRDEQEYWQHVHSSWSPVKKPRHLLSISDINQQHHLHALLDPSTYSPNTPLRDQLCSLVLTTGSRWSLGLDPTYLSTPAGRALLMLSCCHAATKRLHTRKDASRRKVAPSFDQLMPAYFWSPLVHRLRDGEQWSRFYRRQHRVNGKSLIASRLAVGVGNGSRYDHGKLRFLSDAQLADLFERVRVASTAMERMRILGIHPGDQHMFE